MKASVEEPSRLELSAVSLSSVYFAVSGARRRFARLVVERLEREDERGVVLGLEGIVQSLVERRVANCRRRVSMPLYASLKWSSEKGK